MPDEEFISTPADPNDPWIGQILAGYIILRRLGEGGTGIIYLARHQSLDRQATVKFLPSDMANDASVVQLFLREARAAAKLSHPNIAEVYDAGVIGENIYYLIMERVEGRDLNSILGDLGKLPSILNDLGKLPVAQAVEFIRQAAGALAYAYKKGIIHCDIKPENLLLTNEGIIKVANLGLAKWVGTESSMTAQTGDVLGSLAYIAPEQLRDPHNVDLRSDIYSLGSTFFHLVTGKIPHEGTSPVIRSRHLTDPVPNPRDVNPNLDENIAGIIMKMMAKEPDERYQSMEEVCTALQAFKPSLNESAVHPVTVTVSLRRFMMPGAVAGGVLLLLALAFFFWPRLAHQPPAAAPPRTSLVAAPPVAPPVEPTAIVKLVVADFNKANGENNLGGVFGIWNSGDRDVSGHCYEQVEPGAGPDNSPCWLIVCGISTPRSFGGTWMNLQRIDGSPYDTLSFKAKTDRPTLNFSVECKIKPGNAQIVGQQVVVQVGQQWQTIEIPMKFFALPTLQALDQLVFIFNQEITGPQDATLWIDDIVLSKKN